MSDLNALMRRDGLPPRERLLIKILTCIWPGDQEQLSACLRLSMALGVPRCEIEEVLLQAVLFCGFPRVVNAFAVLEDEWPVAIAPDGGGLDPDAQGPAGRALFETIYADNADAVRAMLRGYHGELLDFILETAYGRILSRPGLAPRLRELIAVGVLAHTDQVPQMIAHGRGARRFGASDEEVRESIFTAIEDADQTDRLARRI